jgi:hypothetical protein
MPRRRRREVVEEPALADFQAALLTLIDEGVPLERLKAQLRAEPRFADYHDYVDSFDPRFVEMLRRLMKLWGRRGDPELQRLAARKGLGVVGQRV